MGRGTAEGGGGVNAGTEKDDRTCQAIAPPAYAARNQIVAMATRTSGRTEIRRQHPIGDYVLDFHFPAAQLAIEVDGEVHSRGDRPERDARRDAWVAENGIRTLRIPAIDVLREFDAVTRLILAECGASPLHHPADGPPPHAAHGEER